MTTGETEPWPEAGIDESGRAPQNTRPLEARFQTVGEVRVANPRMTCRDVNVWYGDKHAIKRRRPRYRQERGHRDDRPVGLRQVDLPACPEPDERHHRHLPGHRRDQARRHGHLRQETRRGAAARPGRHGVPEAEPLPEVHLRQHRLRPAHPRPGQQPRRARRGRRDQPAQGRSVGRGQGPAGPARAPVCPVASSSACASPAPSPCRPR
jgi:hypothetical protein